MFTTTSFSSFKDHDNAFEVDSAVFHPFLACNMAGWWLMPVKPASFLKQLPLVEKNGCLIFLVAAISLTLGWILASWSQPNALGLCDLRSHATEAGNPGEVSLQSGSMSSVNHTGAVGEAPPLPRSVAHISEMETRRKAPAPAPHGLGRSYPELDPSWEEGLGNMPRASLVRGKWHFEKKSPLPSWRDSGLCRKKSCPTATMKLMSNSTRQRINNTWFYFLGDSTMRQVARTFSSQFLGQEMDTQRDAEAFRACPQQVGRQPYVAPPWDQTQCHLNERTCTDNLTYGDYRVKWTIDWKHFIYEDYDEWFFAVHLPRLMKEHGKIPEVLILSTGVHSCFHFQEEKWWPKHFRQIDSFFDLLLQAKPKIVVFLDSGVPLDHRVSGNKTENKCSIVTNKYIGKKVANILQDQQSDTWFSFVSRDNITREAPQSMSIWRHVWKVHLHPIVQEILLAYMFDDLENMLLYARNRTGD